LSDQKYTHFLSTGSGSNQIELVLSDDDKVAIEIAANWMGLGKHHYRLSGSHRSLSSNYGWLDIELVEHSEQPDQYTPLNVSVVGIKVICEYFKIPTSPNLEHPEDLGEMQQLGYANWNETFDLLVILQSSTEGNLYGLTEDTDETMDEAQIKHLTRALFALNKTKFMIEDSDI
jgi:hypothetical protein